MKSIHDLLGMELVTVGEGTKLGKLKGVEIDAQGGEIRYLQFDGEGDRADGFVPWSAVQSVGKHAITVHSSTDVVQTIPACDRDGVISHVGDRPVMTESGQRLGAIVSYDLDETTGRLECYHIGTGGFLGRLMGTEIRFSPAAIRAFGKDAIVVADSIVPAKVR